MKARRNHSALLLLAVACPAGILAFGGAGRHWLRSELLMNGDHAAAPPVSTATPPAPPNPSGATSDLRDQMLREAIELLEDGDLPAALRALDKAVRNADGSRLAELSKHVRHLRGVELAELLAQVRIREATEAYRARRGFRLRGVTLLEREALVAELRAAEQTLREQAFDGRTLAQWAAAPQDYPGLTDASRRLVADAGLLSAILAARLEHDPSLKQPSTARRDVAEFRVRLMRLASGVAALPGLTDGPASAPASEPIGGPR